MNFEQELAKISAEVVANPLDYVPLVERGNLLAEGGRWQDAIADYSAALRLAQSPDDALIYDNRGVARLYLLDYYPALADFSQAVTLDPTYFYALANRAYVYALLEKPSWALEDARRALELCPELAPAYDVMGQAYAQLGQLEEALAALTEAIALDAGCVQAPYHRAAVLQRLGRPEEARADLLRYLAMNDDQQNASARQTQAQHWLSEFNLPEA